ncbi:MAG TPA: hypothetical protein PLD77_01545 [Candidatus Dojkabacteria bacterium]|nr:hypothetical protein [Candidatus Dojkabacteria bacterium]
MTDYGKGSVLGAATTLPTTSAGVLLLSNGIHPMIVLGFIIISSISTLITISYLFRYLKNRTK